MVRVTLLYIYLRNLKAASGLEFCLPYGQPAQFLLGSPVVFTLLYFIKKFALPVITTLTTLTGCWLYNHVLFSTNFMWQNEDIIELGTPSLNGVKFNITISIEIFSLAVRCQTWYLLLTCKWTYEGSRSICNIHVHIWCTSQASKAVQVKLTKPKATSNPNRASPCSPAKNILRRTICRIFSNNRPSIAFKRKAAKTRKTTSASLRT